MENFSRLRGRPFLLNQLMRPVTAGRVNHAQIFSGPRGMGKKSAAMLVARAVNCTGAGSKPCGSCPSCLRFKDGTPPCLQIVEPDGKSIKIEQIRAVIDDLMIRPESGMKVVIIHEADRMTPQAQNALLKTLEEPPEYALFLLITESHTTLLPTIRSRCILLRFAPLGAKDIAEILISNGIDPETAERAAAASAGSPGEALKIASGSSYNELSDALIKAFDGLKITKDVAKCCSGFTSLKDKSREMLSMLESCACEMMPAQNGLDIKLSPLSRKLIENRIDGADLLKAVLRCTELLNSNVAFQNAVEMLLYDITYKK